MSQSLHCFLPCLSMLQAALYTFSDRCLCQAQGRSVESWIMQTVSMRLHAKSS